MPSTELELLLAFAVVWLLGIALSLYLGWRE